MPILPLSIDDWPDRAAGSVYEAVRSDDAQGQALLCGPKGMQKKLDLPYC